jgi:hypothetical protein
MHGLRMFGLFSGFGLEPWGGTRDSRSPRRAAAALPELPYLA